MRVSFIANELVAPMETDDEFMVKESDGWTKGEKELSLEGSGMQGSMQTPDRKAVPEMIIQLFVAASPWSVYPRAPGKNGALQSVREELLLEI